MNPIKIQKSTRRIVIAKPIQLIVGLSLWGYGVIFHMDCWGIITTGIGMLFYGYSIAQGKIVNG